MTARAALTASGIGVSFSGVEVLRDVSLDILPGEDSTQLTPYGPDGEGSGDDG